MSALLCDYAALASKGVQGLRPYLPGKPIEELERELGLTDIVKLASNENPLGLSSKAATAINDVMASGARYPDGNGFILKQALSDYFKCRQQQIALEQITLGNGSNDVLDLIARAYAQPGSEVIYSEYAFAVYAISCQSVGAKAVVTPAQSWGHDLDAMLEAITNKTSLIFIANPNNPTGTALTSVQVKKFLDQVPAHVLVVLDEAYCEYIDDEDFPDGVALLSSYSNLIVTRTFSKAWGLASMRVGYAISNPVIADILNRVRQPFNVNSFALAAASAVLKDSEYLCKGKEINQSGLKQVSNGLNVLGLAYITSKGNFISFDVGRDAEGVFQALLSEGVIVRPLANYAMSHFLRVSIGLESENQRFLDALQKVLRT